MSSLANQSSEACPVGLTPSKDRRCSWALPSRPETPDRAAPPLSACRTGECTPTCASSPRKSGGPARNSPRRTRSSGPSRRRGAIVSRIPRVEWIALTCGDIYCIVQLFAMTKTETTHSPDARSAARVGRIQNLVCQLGRLLESMDSMCLSELDITVSQGYTLMVLPQDGEVGMSALGEALGVAPSTATRMVDQLARKRLVTRRSAPGDRRAVRVALTPRGQALRRTVEQATASCFLGAFAEIPAAQQAATIGALELVNACLCESLKAGCSGGICPTQ